LAHGIKFSLSARIAAVQRHLSQTLDSFWFFLVSVFSRKPTSSENKPPQHIGDIGAQDSQTKPHKRLIRTVEWVIGISASLLTITGFYLSYAPKISVDPSDSLTWYSPLATTFVLSNEGSLDIHNVTVSAPNLYMENGNPKTGFSVRGPWEFTNIPKDATADILSAGHKMGLPYPRNFGFTAINNFTGGHFTFIVRYRPDWLPWRKREIFPFEAIRTSDGKWIWEPVAQ